MLSEIIVSLIIFLDLSCEYKKKPGLGDYDYGKMDTAPYDAIVDPDAGFLIDNCFRIRVDLYENLRPGQARWNHDSKRDTGMVGLENLGATCYLNALLQV